MPGSFTLFRVGVTSVRVDSTLFLLLLWFVAEPVLAGRLDAAFDLLLFFVLVFACVLVHEFGHVFAARRYGISTESVVLWGLGGIAQLDRAPRRPAEQIVISLAGPATNVVIAGLLIAAGAAVDIETLSAGDRSLAARLAVVNLYLAIFNLIPAYPLDGGQALRGVLSWWIGRRRAAQITAVLGVAIGIAMGLYALVAGSFLLGFIAIFIVLYAWRGYPRRPAGPPDAGGTGAGGDGAGGPRGGRWGVPSVRQSGR